MERITKEERFFTQIRDFSNEFLNMSEAERIACIERYSVLWPYQKHVLRQMKTIMSKAEKQAYKKALSNEKLKDENASGGPQPT